LTFQVAGKTGLTIDEDSLDLTAKGSVHIEGPGLYNKNGFEILETDSDKSWLRINHRSHFDGTAIYKPLAIGTAGLSVGDWSKLPDGQLKTTSSAFLATSGGNVGIGTQSPTQKLDVNGTVQATRVRTDNYTPKTADWAIKRSGENLQIIEPEQSDKVWAEFKDDQHLHLKGTPNLIVDGHATIKKNTIIEGDARIDGSLKFSGTVTKSANATTTLDSVKIKSTSPFCALTNVTVKKAGGFCMVNSVSGSSGKAGWYVVAYQANCTAKCM